MGGLWWLVLLALMPLIDGARVDLDNDGPAVVGAPIMFTAQVHLDHGEDRPDQLVYEWSDDGSPRHYNKSDPTTALEARMLVTYEAFGVNTMTVKVKEPRPILPDWVVGEQSTLCRITMTLNGGIELSQAGVNHREPGHVSTRNESLLTVRFRDPHHFLDSASKIEYFWSINDRINLGPYDQPELRYNFTEVGETVVRCTTVAHFSKNVSAGVLTDSTKWGFFHLGFVVDEPVSVVNITGNNWLKHGELLNLTLNCNGTGPWSYCVRYYSGRHNITGNETCPNALRTDVCKVHLQQYLRNNGSYTAVCVLSNAVSRLVTPVTITVYTATRQQQLSYYIIPLSCALAALVFILFGSIKLIKSRRDYNLEIADFDFSQPRSADHPSFGRRLLVSLWPGGARRATAGPRAAETDAILPRGRTRRRSYGLVEDYEED